MIQELLLLRNVKILELKFHLVQNVHIYKKLTAPKKGINISKVQFLLIRNIDNNYAGQSKETPTQLKKVCKPWNKGVSLSSAEPTDDADSPESSRIVRMNKDEYYLVAQISRDGTSRAMPDFEGKSGSVRLLRPTAPYPSDLKKQPIARDTEGRQHKNG